MKIKASLLVIATFCSGAAMAQSALEGFYGQVGIGYNDLIPKADNVSATIVNGPYAGQYSRTSRLDSTSELSGGNYFLYTSGH
jgi:hypothetical protein